MTQTPRESGLYIILISVHGLVRGQALELGRDADTGGQIQYVIELARALAADERVGRVDLLTRQVIDPKVGDDYARPHEELAPGAHIVRIPCGPRRYLRKEVLWPHLDSFADNALHHLRRIGRVPDLIHSHYADAGYVGARLAGLLGVPLVHTGHSLGREKRRRLRDQGVRPETIDKHYSMNQRIEAEEFALDNAALVVASTRQEVDRQYAIYDNYQPERMIVIPPGVDLTRFAPAVPGEPPPAVAALLTPFLREPDKPMILSLSRADERKNLPALVQAYGEDPRLQELANLVIVAGNRDDIAALERGPQAVLTELLLLIDRYDLYGRVAYPKQHRSDDVPAFYRLAAARGGVFVNPALTEPFGLTLIEAAASGLPIVATEDGGPRDIVAACANGLLVDPLDTRALADAIHQALSDEARWSRWSRAGIDGAHAHYSWRAHVAKYLAAAERLVKKAVHRPHVLRARSKLPTLDRLLISDIDNTLIGDGEALRELLDRLEAAGSRVGFGVATGRRLDSVVEVLEEWGVPQPDVIVSAVGTEIHYGAERVADESYQRHLGYRWDGPRLREAMRGLPGIRIQEETEQRRFKLSYYVDPDEAPPLRDISRHLRRQRLQANVVFSHGQFLDLLPVRASKGGAVRYLAMKWGIPLERILVAGDSGNDEEMLTGNTLGVVVGNHSEELAKLRGRERIYFAQGHYARGILEGIEHYRFMEDHYTTNKAVADG